MLQAGRLRARFHRRSLDFLMYLILRSVRRLTQMRTRNLPGVKVQAACKSYKLTAICEPLVYIMQELRRLITLWTSTPVPLPVWPQPADSCSESASNFLNMIQMVALPCLYFACVGARRYKANDKVVISST
jgi:hypothetical protein